MVRMRLVIHLVLTPGGVRCQAPQGRHSSFVFKIGQTVSCSACKIGPTVSCGIGAPQTVADINSGNMLWRSSKTAQSMVDLW
jgi:hypothetical protein